MGEWSAGDFMDDSVVTDRIGEKSELRVKGCEGAECGCRGTGRWSVVQKKKKSSLTDKGKWEEKKQVSVLKSSLSRSDFSQVHPEKLRSESFSYGQTNQRN